MFQIGKFDLLVIVDSTEQYCRDHMETGEEEKLSKFRTSTLPVLGHYDDKDRVIVVGCTQLKPISIFQDNTCSAANFLAIEYTYLEIRENFH